MAVLTEAETHVLTTARLGYATMCSGVDSPVVIMNALTEFLGASGFSADHAFSCECHPKKQLWIRQHFSDMNRIFTDMHDIAANTALELVSGCHQPVPGVDMVVAGFVCKSVSKENNRRGDHAHCIQEGSGVTGSTFKALLEYCNQHRPAAVVCENVVGLTHRIK